MKSFKDIVSFFLLPLLYMNLAALAVGAVWLVAVSQLQVIWLGVMMVLFAPDLVIPTLMLPAGLISAAMIRAHNENKPRKGQAFFFLTLAYVLLFFTVWCVSLFEYVVHGVAPGFIYAGIIWGAAVSVTPLLLWASRDRNNLFIMMMVEVAEMAILVLSALVLFGIQTSFWFSFAVFGVLIAAAAVTQALYEARAAKRQG